MDGDQRRSSQSLDHSDMMVLAEECFNSSKKRKLEAEEADLLVLPQPKHFCLEQQAESSCPSSDIEFAECSYSMEVTKTGHQNSFSASTTEDSAYSTRSLSCVSTISNNIDHYCSKVNDETQEYVEDLTHMDDFICPEFAVEDLQEVLNPVDSYVLSPARWRVNNQDSEETTIDQEFEEYFSALMM